MTKRKPNKFTRPSDKIKIHETDLKVFMSYGFLIVEIDTVHGRIFTSLDRADTLQLKMFLEFKLDKAKWSK